MVGGRNGGPATRQDVANLAGVSTAVVSYVVNNGPRRVSPATKQRVVDAIAQLNYRPNARGRALRLGKTNTYALAVPDVVNIFTGNVVGAVEREMASRGWSMLLGHAHNVPATEAKLLDDMIRRGVEGIITLMSATPSAEWLGTNYPVPIVMMDRSTPLFGYRTIGPDFAEAGRMATQHMLAHGKRTIVPVHGELLPIEPNLRLLGYQQAMVEVGLTPEEAVVTDWTWSREGGFLAGQQILARSVLPDAVFCFSDMIAVGLAQALQLGGLRIPEDIAVIAFDGTEATQYSWPPITTVSQPTEEMAAAAVAALELPKPEGHAHSVFPVRMTTRRSCGCSI